MNPALCGITIGKENIRSRMGDSQKMPCFLALQEESTTYSRWVQIGINSKQTNQKDGKQKAK